MPEVQQMFSDKHNHCLPDKKLYGHKHGKMVQPDIFAPIDEDLSSNYCDSIMIMQLTSGSLIFSTVLYLQMSSQHTGYVIH